jgi:heme/copper-type cytochrome/quinol oxidase subunit 4
VYLPHVSEKDHTVAVLSGVVGCVLLLVYLPHVSEKDHTVAVLSGVVGCVLLLVVLSLVVLHTLKTSLPCSTYPPRLAQFNRCF